MIRNPYLVCKATVFFTNEYHCLHMSKNDAKDMGLLCSVLPYNLWIPEVKIVLRVGLEILTKFSFMGQNGHFENL